MALKKVAITTHKNIDDGMGIHLQSIIFALEQFCEVIYLDDSTHYSINYLDSFDYIIRYGWRVVEDAGFDNGSFDWNISSTSSKNILVVCFDCRMLSPDKIQEIEVNFETIIFDSSYSQQNGFEYFAHKVTEIVSPAILDYPNATDLIPKTDKPYTFLHISNSLHYIKGIDIIVEAFKYAFDSSNNDVRLEILATEKGNGLSQIKEAFKHAQRSHQLLINEQRYPHEKIWELYLDAHCYVCASRSETFSLPTVEAASIGLPIIMHNNGGMRDYSPMCVHYTPKSQPEIIQANKWRRNQAVSTLRPSVRSLAGRMVQAYNEKRRNPKTSQQALVLRYSVEIIQETLQTIISGLVIYLLIITLQLWNMAKNPSSILMNTDFALI